MLNKHANRKLMLSYALENIVSFLHPWMVGLAVLQEGEMISKPILKRAPYAKHSKAIRNV